MFLTRLKVTEGEGETWVLDRPLVWNDGKRRFAVPAGFVTDLDSVPRLPVIWLLLKGRSRAAAVLHDWLYSEGLVSRREADAIFFAAMKATAPAAPVWMTGLPWLWAIRLCIRLWWVWLWLQRTAIWAGVRLFGRRYFRQMRADRGGEQSRALGARLERLSDECRRLIREVEQQRRAGGDDREGGA